MLRKHGQWGAALVLAALLGGLACLVGVALLARRWTGFRRYDARHPEP